MAGLGGDQRSRDRLRTRSQRLKRRRRGLDAVSTQHLGPVRGRRQQRRLRGPLQPRRRDLRRGPLPQGCRWGHQHPRRDPRLQPLPGLPQLGAPARASAWRHATRTARRDHRPDRSPLPRVCRLPLRRRLPRHRRLLTAHRARHHDRQPGRRARNRRPGRHDRPHRPGGTARTQHLPPGRLRQHLRLLRAGQHRHALSHARSGRIKAGALPDTPVRLRLRSHLGAMDRPPRPLGTDSCRQRGNQRVQIRLGERLSTSPARRSPRDRRHRARTRRARGRTAHRLPDQARRHRHAFG